MRTKAKQAKSQIDCRANNDGPSLNQPNRSPQRWHQSYPEQNQNLWRLSQTCYHCRKENCNTCSCPVVAADIEEGICHCQPATDHIILPGGSKIPQNVPGNTMCERFLEWHRQHPGQKTQGSSTYSNILTIGTQAINESPE